MAHEENERPRPHGDPLRDSVEDNAPQRQSDAPGPDDEDTGEERKRQYKDNGAGLVSRID